MENNQIVKKRALIFIACLILIAVYVGQQVSYAAALNVILPEAMHMVHPYTIFIINKTIRLTLNDMACMLLIYALFPGKAYLKVAFWLFLIEVWLILPVYFVIKLNLEGDSEISSPLLSQIHRLIVNPLLMFLLMMGFLYQKITHKSLPSKS
jgi:exosortase F-associated protein